MLVKKNIVILHPSDKRACAFYRCHAITMMLNSDKGGEVETIVSRAEIADDYILKYTAAVVFFRVQNDEQATMLMHYNAAQAWQRTMMDEKHYWMDDLRYISRWLRTFFGDTIQAHF